MQLLANIQQFDGVRVKRLSHPVRPFDVWNFYPEREAELLNMKDEEDNQTTEESNIALLQNMWDRLHHLLHGRSLKKIKWDMITRASTLFLNYS